MTSTPPPLELAHRLASEGEDFYEEGRLGSAAQRFEAAAEQYVRATLCTSDTESLQSLRLLAISHTQRAHEIVCRMRLHDAQLADPRITPSGSRSWAKAEAGGAGSGAEAGSAVASAALLPRLGSQLISSLEALHFGAEELLCIELLMPTVSASSMRGSQLGGGASGAGGGLLDSFYVVPSQPGMLNHGRSVSALGGSAGGSEPGGSEAGGQAALQALQAPHTQRVAALAAENLRLTRENATLRQQGAEMHAALGKVQRRAAEQLRLSKKALAALQEVQAAPRPQLPPSSAQEIADLRSQLEAAHAVRRQQAEQVRKYEQRWAQLKASARRKQAQQSQQALHKGALGGSPLAARGDGGTSCT
mmetsp:Transcript_25070/g.50898  ORF Transcript_25070/g.50898 Transcript_25070/m.50898 type:complete len:362 (+) Transcript_25070:78-1163(+)